MTEKKVILSDEAQEDIDDVSEIFSLTNVH